jgi:hypothetical protein
MKRFKKFLLSSTTLVLIGGFFATPAWASIFSFSTGAPDGRLGALSRRASLGKLETETADDFILQEPTVITQATINGLTLGAPLANITQVEVEFYHVFPLDSVNPPSGNVLSRVNSPADVEIDSATRDSSLHTLDFAATLLSESFTVGNSVIDGINKKPAQTTFGEGPRTGEKVEIKITFTRPIILPAGHYFFRPEVLVTGGDFLYLSAPRPTAPPLFVGDLQAWIRNSNLPPDWSRIGTDIINNTVPPPTFNMTFSLAGETIPEAGTPGEPNCHGQTVSALAHQFGGFSEASTALRFSSVEGLQDEVRAFCAP